MNDEAPLPPDEIKDEPIDDFLLPPRGKSEPKDFDLLAHLEVKEIIEGEEDDDGDGDEDGGDDLFVQKYRKVTPNI